MAIRCAFVNPYHEAVITIGLLFLLLLYKNGGSRNYCVILRMAYSQTDKTPTFSRGSQAKWIHVGFWVIVTIFFLCDRTYLIYKQGLPNFIACAAVRIMLLVGITYLNLYYFMPRFLMRGRYVIYFILVILSLICYLVLQSIYDLYLYGYILGPTKKEIAFSAISYNICATIWYLI